MTLTKPMPNSPVFTIRQIASAKGITPRAVKKRSLRHCWRYLEESCRGGKRRLYPLDSLPPDVQAVLCPTLPHSAEPARFNDGRPSSSPPASGYDPEALWQWATDRTQLLRDIGARRVAAISELEQLLLHGQPLQAAANTVAADKPFSVATLKRWFYRAKGYEAKDRMAALIPGWSGGRIRQEIPTKAWDWFKSYYLTRAQPTVAESYRRTVESAAAQGWGELPSLRTFANRLKSDVSHATRV